MTQLDPDIILKAFATPQIDLAGVMEKRAQVHQRNVQTQRDQIAYDREQATYGKQQRDQAAQEAAVRLASTGKFDEADQQYGAGAGNLDVHHHIATMHDEHRAVARARLMAAAPVAIQARQATDPGTRAQIIQQAAPTLIENGWKPEEIQAFVADPKNLSDQGLDTFLASLHQGDEALKAYDAQQAELSKPFTLGQDQQRFAGDGHLIAAGPESIKAVTTPADSTTTIFGGAGHTGAGGIPYAHLVQAEGGTDPDGRFRISPKGAVGPAQLMPGTMAEAARIAGVPFDPVRARSDPQYNLQLGEAYYNSLRQKYGDDTKAAAAYNCGPARLDAAIRRGGANWQAQLPRETRNYITKVGGNGPMVIHGPPKPPPADTATPLDANAIDYVAQQYAATGQMPPLGMGKQAAAMRARIIGRAAVLARQQGISGTDAAGFHADFKANSAALSTLQRSANQIIAYERTANYNADQVLQTMGRGAAKTGMPIFNAWVQAGRRQVSGDPDVTKFDVAVNTFATEYARVVSGATGGAVTSDSARHEAMAMINAKQTPQQLAGAIAQMRRDMANRKRGLTEQAESLRQTLRTRAGNQPSGGGNIPTFSPEQARNAPKGTRFRTTDGRVMVRQ